MSRLFLRQLAKLGPEHVELYWLAGLCEEKNAWFVRTVMRGVESNRYSMVSLPIGFSPLLSLGHVFAEGEMLSLPARGIFGSATVMDVSDYEEITSADIPPGLYPFGGNGGGIQRLFRYSTAQGEVLIPAIELIRYLFLHNRTLANAVIRPGALNLLFHPEVPGYQRKLTLRFSSRIPKSCLSRQFAQEFAWIALDPDARRAWDSVCLKSHGKQYVTFAPPPLKESVWKFRGIQHGNQWLVLELLHLTGKNHPCDELHYGHPSMKEVIRSMGENGDKSDPDSDNDDSDTSREHVVYDYELDDGQEGATAGGQKTTDVYSKQSDFDKIITVEKLLIKLDRPGGMQTKVIVSTTGTRTEIRKTIKVSSGEQSLSAKLPPIEFNLLMPATWDCIGDLEALAGTVRHMAHRLPQVRFAMSLCQLKAGRVFSMANRKPRVGLVVTITPPDNPPIVLLDVERTGDVALSLVALRFHSHATFDIVEASVKRALDGLVDGSGHWDHEIERELTGVCACERLPKMLTPRNKADAWGQTALWAVKLLRRLGLEVAPSDFKSG
ncbi:MAG: hypothetical protein HKM00_08380 [Gallionella sp.]|jgi:hypothetical protein|nr:hypothetical protein [Gallionella sp.]